MKADLYSAQVQTAAGSGLAHRTAAGFVVLTSPDGQGLIDLIDAQQNEHDLIDQVVAAASAGGPAAFAMLFTAGGELFLLISGEGGATVASDSASVSISAAGDHVLVHQVAAGINETAAAVRLTNGAQQAGPAVTNFPTGTIAADCAEIGIGGHPLANPAVEPEPETMQAAAQAPVASPAPPAAEELVFADDPAPEPEPEPEPTVSEPEPTVSEPEPTVSEPEPTVSEPEPLASADVGPVMVLGVACSQGHHNHPDAVYCSQCGSKMGVHHTTVLLNGPRPPLGVLVVDDGNTYSLSEDLVIGREPSSHPDVAAGSASPMILIDDTLSMSRKHARIVLQDWSVAVTDLGSSNGTFLARAGAAESWSQLAANVHTPLEPGDRLRIGGRIIQVELHHVR